MTQNHPTLVQDRRPRVGPPVAHRSAYWLQGRIEAYLLEKARLLFEPLKGIQQDGNAESLHQMRVASRRLRIGIRFFSELFSQSELKQVQRQLRRLTRALGDIRGMDVHIRLLRRTASQPSPGAARGRRTLVQNLLLERAMKLVELRELMQALEIGKFELRVRALITKRECHRDSKRILQEATDRIQQLRRALRRRHKQFLKNRGDRAFHSFRVAAKRYRYALEASQAVFQIRLKDRIRAVERLQDLMGEYHDVELLVIYLKETQHRWDKDDKTLAEGISLLVKYYRREQKDRFSRFEEFLTEKWPWLKKVKLQANEG